MTVPLNRGPGVNFAETANGNGTGNGTGNGSGNGSGSQIETEVMEVRVILITSAEGMIRLIYLLVVTIAIILGNVMVIVAVGKFRKLRKNTNLVLASLAVADLLVGVITVPLYIAWTTYPGIFDNSPFLCRTALLSSLLVVAASQLNLMVLSVERYLAVCIPFKHRTLVMCCPWLHIIVICLTWAVSLVSTGLSSLAIEPDNTVCNYYKSFNRWFLFFAVIFGIFIPFIGIIFMNVKVFTSVVKHEMRSVYFKSDTSECVRAVTDSSDQEIRVPLFRPSVRRSLNSDLFHSRRKMFPNPFSCCLIRRIQRRSTVKESLGEIDEVFLEEKMYSSGINDEFNSDDLSKNNPPSMVSCGKGFGRAAESGKESRDATIISRCDSINQNFMGHILGDEEIIHMVDSGCGKDQSLVGLSGECLCNETGSDISFTPKTKLIPTKARKRGIDIDGDMNYYNIKDWYHGDHGKSEGNIFSPSQTSEESSDSDRQESYSLMDTLSYSEYEHVSLLEPKALSVPSLLMNNIFFPPKLSPISRRIYKKIEQFATPRILPKHQHSRTTRKSTSPETKDCSVFPSLGNICENNERFLAEYREDKKTGSDMGSTRQELQEQHGHGLEQEQKLKQQHNQMGLDKGGNEWEKNDQSPKRVGHHAFKSSSPSLTTIPTRIDAAGQQNVRDNLMSTMMNSTKDKSLNDKNDSDHNGMSMRRWCSERQLRIKDDLLNQVATQLPKSYSNIHSVTPVVNRASFDRLLSFNIVTPSREIKQFTTAVGGRRSQSLSTIALDPISPLGEHPSAGHLTRRFSDPAPVLSEPELDLIQRDDDGDNDDDNDDGYEDKHTNDGNGEEENLHPKDNRGDDNDYDASQRQPRRSNLSSSPSPSPTPRPPGRLLSFSCKKDTGAASSTGQSPNNGNGGRRRTSRMVSRYQEEFPSGRVSVSRDGSLVPAAYVSKKVARTVSIVCFSFILAWLPFFAVIIANTFCDECDLVYFLNVVLMITFAQSAFNPVIYALCHASFRNAYKSLFRQICVKLEMRKNRPV